MESMQTRELVSYATAMQMAGLPERTFYKRLKQSLVPIYFDSADQRKRWIDRNDIPKLIQAQGAGRSTESSAA